MLPGKIFLLFSTGLFFKPVCLLPNKVPRESICFPHLLKFAVPTGPFDITAPEYMWILSTSFSSFLLLHFICFKILQCHKSRILTTLHLEKCKFWSPEPARYIPTKLQNFNWLQTWNRLYVNPACLPNVVLVAQLQMCIKWENSHFWK